MTNLAQTIIKNIQDKQNNIVKKIHDSVINNILSEDCEWNYELTVVDIKINIILHESMILNSKNSLTLHPSFLSVLDKLFINDGFSFIAHSLKGHKLSFFELCVIEDTSMYGF